MKSIEIFLDVIELLMRTALPLKNRTCWKYNAFVYDNTERKKVPEKIRCILQAAQNMHRARQNTAHNTVLSAVGLG